MATATVPVQKTTTRIAALDGWRGIAILGVLEAHFFHPNHPWIGLWGGQGVTVFFVLSGYLITGNLLRELDNGGIQLRRFYLRRIFRLWPCAWVYQAVVLLLLAIAAHRFMWRDAMRCIVFIRNYGGSAILTEHFWSLSIEEQFYLVWPLALVIFRKRAAWIAMAGIIFVGVFRWNHWNIWTDHVHYMGAAATQFQADSLLSGCLIAILKQNYPRLFGNLNFLTALVAILLPVAVLHTYVSHTAGVLCIGVALVLTVQFPALNRIFSFRPLVKLGVVSYSLYVWQQLFAHMSFPVHLWLVFIAIAIAIVSYEYIEKPGMRLGSRLMSQ